MQCQDQRNWGGNMLLFIYEDQVLQAKHTRNVKGESRPGSRDRAKEMKWWELEKMNHRMWEIHILSRGAGWEKENKPRWNWDFKPKEGATEGHMEDISLRTEKMPPGSGAVGRLVERPLLLTLLPSLKTYSQDLNQTQMQWPRPPWSHPGCKSLGSWVLSGSFWGWSHQWCWMRTWPTTQHLPLREHFM